MIFLLLIAFISGLITILAPCIWPLLPVVLSASALGGRRRALGISLGIVSSFGVFTLLTSYLVSLLAFDANILRIFAVSVIGLLGMTLLVPALSKRFEAQVSGFSGKFGSKLQVTGGFWGGLILGLALGVVWTPCAGPILATIATLAATKAVNLQIVIVTFVYCFGIGIPLFVLASFGSKIFAKSKFVGGYTGRLQQIFGAVMILTALAIFTNYDKVLELKLLSSFPSYSQLLDKFEGLAGGQLNSIKGKGGSTGQKIQSSNLRNYGPVPEFAGIANWLNSNSLTMSQLRGKVVLVDFWTYTCINCIRTLPYVTSWYEKYKDRGFVVVGVHTPEFEFEKNTANVAAALKQYKINYPVAQDNDYKTWNAYSNQYWPAHYLIDARGNVRDFHFGEGDYDKTEEAIKQLLVEAGSAVDSNLVNFADQTPKTELTAETYLGMRKMERFASNEQVRGGMQNFTLPNSLSQDHFAYQGSWDVQAEFAKAQSGSELFFNFNAAKVFLVMHPAVFGETVKVYLDGKLVDDLARGDDVRGGQVTLDRDRLYNLINLKAPGRHLLRLEFGGGTSVYAFTFG